MKKFIIALLIFIPINVNADIIVYEMNSNRVLYEDNIHSPKLIASISKVMTAIIAIESEMFTETVTVSNEIDTIVCSCIYIEKGEEIKMEDLVYGLLLRSGNDAAMTIAKNVGGSVDDFVAMMNAKAAELGMNQTHFYNPSGLDDDGGNYSTAYDMALLTTYAMKNKEFRKIFETKKHVAKSSKKRYKWVNKNKLLFTYEYTTGGKTGYTRKAGRTLISTSSKDGLDIVVVTLKVSDDFNLHKTLYEQSFKKYENYKIFRKKDINKINENFIDGTLYIEEEFYYPLAEDEIDSIKVVYNLNTNSDYEDDDVVGNITVYLKDQIIHNQDIYVSKPAKRSLKDKIFDFFGKILDWFK